MWNWSLPQFLTRYLLQQIRAASIASEDSCSSSSETKWTERANSSTPAFFLPKSKIRIFGSGTPRLNLKTWGKVCSYSIYNTSLVYDPFWRVLLLKMKIYMHVSKGCCCTLERARLAIMKQGTSMRKSQDPSASKILVILHSRQPTLSTFDYTTFV